MRYLLTLILLTASSLAYGQDQSRHIRIFSASWCPPCRALKSACENDSRLISRLRQFKTKLFWDEEKHRKFFEQAEVTQYPTIVIYNADEFEIGRRVGFEIDKVIEFIDKTK